MTELLVREENLSEVKRVRVDKVCAFRGGGTPSKQNPDFWRGSVPWVSPKDMKSECIVDTIDHITNEAIANSSTSKIPAGSVLVVVRSGILARTIPIAIAGTELAINQDLKALVPSDRVDSRFLYYSLKSHESYLLSRVSRSATVHRLGSSELRSIEIPLSPISEQRRLVAILDDAFAAVARAKVNSSLIFRKARELLDGQVHSLLRQVEGRKSSLGKTCDLLTGYPFKSAHYAECDQGVKLLRGDNIHQGYLRWEDVKRWPRIDVEPYTRFLLQEGDVVVAMDRPWVKAGLKRARIAKQDLPCLQVQRTARLRAKPDLCERYLTHLLSTKDFEHHILGSQTGSGVPHISARQIKAFEFTLPPLEIQKSISRKLDDLQTQAESLQRIYLEKDQALQELGQSLLHQAFAGKL